jgi:hypothetical protein
MPFMQTETIECPELSGKVIQTLTIHRSDAGGQEVMIDFSDGTSLSCSFESTLSVKASLIRTGIGEPKTLIEYAD